MKKNFICKCKKTVSGVTLIALIVNVIVALILAGVGIVTLTSKDEVIEKSKLAKEKIEGYTEKESDMVKDTLKYPNSSDCKHKNTEKRNATGTFSGDTYCLDCGVLLATGTIKPCETHPTTTITEAVAATCCSKGNTGNTICTVCGFVVTPGTEIPINSSNHVGGTEVRNVSDSYTGDTYCLGCGVIIKKGIVDIAGLDVGAYVEYNVEYTDISFAAINYTTETGWRYLGNDENGNYLIISTGVPMMFRYKYSSSATWWGTDSQVASEFGSTYATGASNYPNRYAAYGLRYNLEKITYVKEEVPDYSVSAHNNKLIGMFDGSSNGTLGTVFRATNIPANKILSVRTLTLAELNQAVNRINGNTARSDDDTTNPPKFTGTAKGLFYLEDLDSGYTGSFASDWSFGYWLASPYTGETTSVHSPEKGMLYVKYGGGSSRIWKNQTNSTSSDYEGLRPVIVLSSDIQLSDIDSDGRLEIVY